MTIPKLIHYVWVGPKPMPDEDRRRVEQWRDMLPGWEFRFWNNDNVDFTSSYLAGAYSVRAWNRVSDYTRMNALTRFGGVYLDTDIDLHRPLDPLLRHAAFLGFQAGDELPATMVNGAVFGAEPGHWLTSAIKRKFDTELDGRVNIGAYAGPGLLTEHLRASGLDRYHDEPLLVRDVMVFPKRFFYPYSWKEEYSPAVVQADTFAVHRWAESWVNRKPAFRVRLRRAFLARFARYAPKTALHMARRSTRAANAPAAGS